MQNPRPVAIVTGASRGIGRAIAVELAKAGYDLVLAARNRAQLEETRRVCGLTPERALLVLIDLAEHDAPDNLIETANSRYGCIDVLVNNAGFAPPRSILTKHSAADVERMIAVNLRAPIALTRLAITSMIPGGAGTIVNIASTAGRDTPGGEAVYAATKAGLIAFTRACFADLRATGVRISVVIPGLVDTPFIPTNKRLDRALMLTPTEVATAVVQIIRAPDNLCPLELVLQPKRNPERH